MLRSLIEALDPVEKGRLEVSEEERVFRVGILGSYGGMNLGDEAILQAIVQELRRSLPTEITVFTRDPEDTLKRHQVERAVPVREMSRKEILPEIQRLDLFILGGGGILFDSDIRAYLREVFMAHDAGVPVMVYAIGAGPLREVSSQALVRDALDRAALVTVRDREANKVLEEAGVHREITVTADPAFLLSPEPLSRYSLRREGLEGRQLVGISVREPGPAAPDISEDHYHNLLASAADYVVDRLDADLVFVPMEPHTLDLQHSHAVISRMAAASRATVLKGDYSSGQILALVGRFKFALGMRLHFLMFAAMQRVPFVALPYAGKVLGFMEQLGVHQKTFQRLPLQQMSTGQLIAYVDRAWDFRKDMKARLDEGIPSLEQRARETNRLAVEILKGIPASRRAA